MSKLLLVDAKKMGNCFFIWVSKKFVRKGATYFKDILMEGQLLFLSIKEES